MNNTPSVTVKEAFSMTAPELIFTGFSKVETDKHGSIDHYSRINEDGVIDVYMSRE